MTQGGRLALVFDDGYAADREQVLPVLEELDATASFAIVSEWLGRDDHLDATRLRDLVDVGCEVLAHGRRHRVLRPHRLAADAHAGDRRLRIESHVFPDHDAGVVVGDEYELTDRNERTSVEVVGKGAGDVSLYVELKQPLQRGWAADDTVFRLPEPTLVGEIAGAGDDLRELGFDPNGFVFPYDAADVRAHRIARETYGVIPNAAVRSLPNPRGTPGWNLRRYYLETDQLTRVEIEDYLDAVAADGGLGILAGHSEWDTVSPERIAFTIEAARDREIEVATVSEAIAGNDG